MTSQVKALGEELKPCPFCGKPVTLTSRPDNADETEFVAFVSCFCGGYASCAHKMGRADTQAEANAAAREEWNTRATQEAQSLPDVTPASWGKVYTNMDEFLRDYHAGKSKGAQSPPAGVVLAADHTGMRVDYQGLLRQARDGLKREPANAEMLRQLTDHLTELGARFYAGEVGAVDEFLQLYCIAREQRAVAKGGA